MRLSVLGPIRAVTTDGRDAAIGGPQARRLLAALVVHSPHAISRDTLDDLLWPGGAPSANALQAQISKLRKALNPLEIASTATGYALSVEPATVDVHQFERLVTAGRNAAASGDADTALDRFEKALSLWRGAPYVEAADHFAAQAAAARLESLRVAALGGKLEAQLARGELDEVAAQLDALVSAEPLMEPWWALLMLARYRQGRQTDALRAYADARRALAAELGLEPGPELRQLEARILSHDPSLLATPGADSHRPRPASADSLVRLPARVSSFIGRSAEIVAISSLVEHNRLVTLLGPGGAGKTSTAIEFARRHAAAGEVRLVELAPMFGAAEMVAGVARALGVPELDRAAASDTTDDFERLADLVGGRRLLLIADNCEHILDDVARLVQTLLRRCDGLQVLATSRAPLGVPGESLWRIPPLAASEAAELFLARAAAAGSPLALDAETALNVDELASRLDGLPLAIELAAARTRTLTLEELIDRIDDRFELLSVGPRTVEPRQQTLRALVDWSHDLLDGDERIVFRRLATCAGGASAHVAVAVCADHDIDDARVWPAVERLVDKSLVVLDRSPAGARVRMLQTLYDYAVERLFEAGETELIRRRHAAFFAATLMPAEHGLLGPEQSHWLSVISAERENVVVAFDHALAWGDAELVMTIAAPMGWYFFMMGENAIGAHWMRQAVSCPGPSDPRRRSHVLGLLAWLSITSPQVEYAEEAALEALYSLGRYDDPWTECIVATAYVITHLYLGHLDECLVTIDLVTSAAARAGNRWSAALAMILEAEVALHSGDVAASERGYANAIDALAANGDQFLRAVAVTQAVELAEARGQYDWAVRTLEELAAIAGKVGFSMSPIALEPRLANLEMLRGNLALAAERHRAVLASAAAAESPWLQAISLTGLAAIARREGRPDAAVDLLDQALELPRTQAVPVIRSQVLTARGYTADQLGDVETALRCQRMSLDASNSLRGKRAIANAVEGLAGAYALAGEALLAARLLGYADSLRRSSTGPMPAEERFDVDRAETRARAALGDAEFIAEFDHGASAGELDAILHAG